MSHSPASSLLPLLALLSLSVVALPRCGDDPASPPTCPETACEAGTLCVEGGCVDQREACPAGFVEVAAGTFDMGSPPTEVGRLQDEEQRAVTLTRAFCLQATEVTRSDFAALMGSDPSTSAPGCTTCPVDQVRWAEAASYSNALSARDGLAPCYACTGALGEATLACAEVGDPYTCEGYRLPLEAEWEYAARAGTTTAFPGGDASSRGFCDEPSLAPYAWYCGNADNAIHAVGQRQANAWGLFDMNGNVSEWCHDDRRAYDRLPNTDPNGAFAGSRAIRGGTFESNPESCRAASRGELEPGATRAGQGFRVARGLTTAP